MSEAIELYKKDGATAGIFYCSECRCVYKTRDEADNCHGEKLCACGKKIERRFYAECDDFQSKRWNEESRQKEAERLEKAKKISEKEYTGTFVFGPDDNYYEDIESAIDQYLEGQEPEYVWACKDIGVPKANAESIYENLLDNMWEDADHNDLNGVDELEAAVEAFNKANDSIHVWTPDYSTAVLVEPREKAITA